MTNLKGLIKNLVRASVRYAHLAILEQLGSKVYFPPFFFKHNFDFDALFVPQTTNSRVSVSVSCERLLEGFHLICSSL